MEDERFHAIRHALGLLPYNWAQPAGALIYFSRLAVESFGATRYRRAIERSFTLGEDCAMGPLVVAFSAMLAGAAPDVEADLYATLKVRRNFARQPPRGFRQRGWDGPRLATAKVVGLPAPRARNFRNDGVTVCRLVSETPLGLFRKEHAVPTF
jgi:hypothetical protein